MSGGQRGLIFSVQSNFFSTAHKLRKIDCLPYTEESIFLAYDDLMIRIRRLGANPIFFLKEIATLVITNYT